MQLEQCTIWVSPILSYLSYVVTWLTGKGRFFTCSSTRRPSSNSSRRSLENSSNEWCFRCWNISDTTELFLEQIDLLQSTIRTQLRLNEHNVLVSNTDFRYNMLMHKTTANNLWGHTREAELWKWWEVVIYTLRADWLLFFTIQTCSDKHGERVILLNLHQEKTRYVFAVQPDDPYNGCILLNEDVSIEHFEAVYALEKTQWKFPFTLSTAPKFNRSHAVDEDLGHCIQISADATTWRIQSVLKASTPRWKQQLSRLGNIRAEPPTLR